MATNHTTNYHLNQWEPDDAVERLDFNADNLAVEQALTAHDKTLEGQAASIAALLADVAQCYDPGNLPFVVGTYKGNFSRPSTDDTGGSQTITLGFKPRWVFVYRLAGVHWCCAIADQITYWDMANKEYPLIEILDTGFKAYAHYTSGTYWKEPELNRNGQVYGYIAMK